MNKNILAKDIVLLPGTPEEMARSHKIWIRDAYNARDYANACDKEIVKLKAQIQELIVENALLKSVCAVLPKTQDEIHSQSQRLESWGFGVRKTPDLSWKPKKGLAVVFDKINALLFKRNL